MPSQTDDHTVGNDVREHREHTKDEVIYKRDQVKQNYLEANRRLDGGSVYIYSSKCNTHFLWILEVVEMRWMLDV